MRPQEEREEGRSFITKTWFEQVVFGAGTKRAAFYMGIVS